MRDVLRFVAIASVAICLVPAGAHLFELQNKIGLLPTEYMIVQRIYAGWWLFGIPIIAALLLTALHAAMARSSRGFLLSLLALVCLATTQAIFWTFTYPMNAASNNWTVMPDGFEEARRQWEYSHAVNAALTFAAFVAITLSVLADKRDEARTISSNAMHR